MSNVPLPPVSPPTLTYASVRDITDVRLRSLEKLATIAINLIGTFCLVIGIFPVIGLVTLVFSLPLLLAATVLHRVLLKRNLAPSEAFLAGLKLIRAACLIPPLTTLVISALFLVARLLM